jgi:hypothetical protein
MKPKRNMDEYIGDKFLTLSDVETPWQKSWNTHMYLKHRYGMKVEPNDWSEVTNAYVKK